jgi:hypothetical protein
VCVQQGETTRRGWTRQEHEDTGGSYTASCCVSRGVSRGGCHSHLAARTVVDVLLLEHVAWYQPEELALVTEWLEGYLLPATDSDQIRTTGVDEKCVLSHNGGKSSPSTEGLRSESTARLFGRALGFNHSRLSCWQRLHGDGDGQLRPPRASQRPPVRSGQLNSPSRCLQSWRVWVLGRDSTRWGLPLQ